MRVFNDINEIKNIPNAVVTIGTFDGVHLGHQAIFKRMKELAQSVDGQTVVVTFYPHPRLVLNIDTSNLRFICTQEEKLQKFEDFGIDNVLIINFTKEFSRTPSEFAHPHHRQRSRSCTPAHREYRSFRHIQFSDSIGLPWAHPNSNRFYHYPPTKMILRNSTKQHCY